MEEVEVLKVWIGVATRARGASGAGGGRLQASELAAPVQDLPFCFPPRCPPFPTKIHTSKFFSINSNAHCRAQCFNFILFRARRPNCPFKGQVSPRDIFLSPCLLRSHFNKFSA